MLTNRSQYVLSQIFTSVTDLSSCRVGTAQLELESQCFVFISRGLAVSSRHTYASAMKKFRSFCALFPDLFRSLPIPASAYKLIIFVSWSALSLFPASVVVYLAAVRSYHIDWGFSGLTQNKPRLHRVIFIIIIKNIF